jgi:hypothetical protein
MDGHYTSDLIRRCRWARDHNERTPRAAWSTGERVTVALVLDNYDYLNAIGEDANSAASRMRGDTGLSPDQLSAYLASVRARLTADPYKNALAAMHGIHAGPTISSERIDGTLHIYADGQPLVTAAFREPCWELPYRYQGGDTLRFLTADEVFEQVAWDAAYLSTENFQRQYPCYEPITVDELTEDCFLLRRSDVLLGYVQRDHNTGRWKLIDGHSDEVTVANHPSAWLFRDSAIEYVIGNVLAFVAAAPSATNATPAGERPRS